VYFVGERRKRYKTEPTPEEYKLKRNYLKLIYAKLHFKLSQRFSVDAYLMFREHFLENLF